MKEDKLKKIVNAIYCFGALVLLIRVFLYDKIPYSLKSYYTLLLFIIFILSIIAIIITLKYKKKKKKTKKSKKVTTPQNMEIHQNVAAPNRIPSSILYKLSYYSYIIIYNSIFFYILLLVILNVFEIETHDVLFYIFFVILGALIGYFISDQAILYLRKYKKLNKRAFDQVKEWRRKPIEEIEKKAIDFDLKDTNLKYKLSYYSQIIIYALSFFILILLFIFILFNVEISNAVYYMLFVFLGTSIGYCISVQARKYLRKCYEMYK